MPLKAALDERRGRRARGAMTDDRIDCDPDEEAAGGNGTTSRVVVTSMTGPGRAPDTARSQWHRAQCPTGAAVWVFWISGEADAATHGSTSQAASSSTVKYRAATNGRARLPRKVASANHARTRSPADLMCGHCTVRGRGASSQ